MNNSMCETLISKRIIANNFLPQPPNEAGVWVDQDRSHDYFQLSVSLAAQQGGVSSGSGCMTGAAQNARLNAEERYYSEQRIVSQKIVEKV